MKLTSLTVTNYRSITKAHKLPIRENLTVLIGPNNEGKSNLLSALRASVSVLEQIRSFRPAFESTSAKGSAASRSFSMPLEWIRPDIYNWTRDFPIPLQQSSPAGSSVFGLDFDLSEQEIIEFRDQVGSTLNGLLPVELAVGVKRIIFRVRKQRHARELSQKAAKIASFVSSKLQFAYIPTVRTASESQQVVDAIVARELRIVERNARYRRALREIEAIQRPILQAISSDLTQRLREFLPSVRSVNVEIPEARRSRALRRTTDIIVDDGTPTPLSAKGDGMVSLAAISLMRHASQGSQTGRSLILAIEEPESHLHPRGMHQLHDVIRDIGREHQIIVTTHSPVFVERTDISANLIVQGQKAKCAKSIAEIRDCLGVHISDNLRSSEIVLVVEGEDDRIAIAAILSGLSSTIAQAVDSNRLGIDTLGGAGNLSYKIHELRRSVCRWHCLLDNDDGGRAAYKKAEDNGLIKPKDVTFVRVRGKRDSELEDCYLRNVYADYFRKEYGNILSTPQYVGHVDKWSKRVENAFVQTGLHWDESTERKIKYDVAKLAAAKGAAALRRVCRPVFDALAGRLELLMG